MSLLFCVTSVKQRLSLQVKYVAMWEQRRSLLTERSHAYMCCEWVWVKKKWLNITALLYFFCSFLMFCLILLFFFVVIFLTAPGNNHLKALAIREWPSLTLTPYWSSAFAKQMKSPILAPYLVCPTLYGPMPWTSTYQGSNNRFFPSSSSFLFSVPDANSVLHFLHFFVPG